MTKMVVFYKNDHWSIPTDHHANFENLGIVEVTTLVLEVSEIFLLHECMLL